jgi:hypothetical protein
MKIPLRRYLVAMFGPMGLVRTASICLLQVSIRSRRGCKHVTKVTNLRHPKTVTALTNLRSAMMTCRTSTAVSWHTLLRMR